MKTTLTTRIGHETPRTAFKTAGMMAATPLIGLAYFVLMPVVGLAALAWVAARALATHRDALRTVGMMAVGPLRGLAYILLLPLVGLATLATLEVRHLAAPRHAPA